MTREEAIDKWVIPALKNTWNPKKCEEVLKALEQEPILDKIRAEIRHFMFEINPSSSESDYACNYILDLIDKHTKGGE